VYFVIINILPYTKTLNMLVMLFEFHD
jgi:hypothetical protein